MWSPAAHPFFLMPAIRRPFVGALLRFEREGTSATQLATALSEVLGRVPLLRSRVRWRGPWVGFDLGALPATDLVEVRPLDADAVTLDEAAAELPTSSDRLFVSVVFEGRKELALLVGVSSSVSDARALLQLVETVGEAAGRRADHRVIDARQWSVRRLFRRGAPGSGDTTPPTRVPREGPAGTSFLARTTKVGGTKSWHAPAFLAASLRAAASPRPLKVLWATDGRFATAERLGTNDRKVRLANVSDIRMHTFAPDEVAAEDAALVRTCGAFVEEALRDPVVGDGWAGWHSLIPSRIVERQANFTQASILADTMYASWGGDVGAVLSAFPERPLGIVVLANSPPQADLPGCFATIGQGEVTLSICYDPSRLAEDDARGFLDRLDGAFTRLVAAPPSIAPGRATARPRAAT